MRLLRDVSAVFLSLLLIAAFLPVLAGGTVHAGTVRMNVSEYCFDGTKSSVWIFGLWPQNEDGSANDEAKIESATSSDPDIVAIDSVHSDQVEIKAAGIGTTTIDIAFENGDTRIDVLKRDGIEGPVVVAASGSRYCGVVAYHGSIARVSRIGIKDNTIVGTLQIEVPVSISYLGNFYTRNCIACCCDSCTVL